MADTGIGEKLPDDLKQKMKSIIERMNNVKENMNSAKENVSGKINEATLKVMTEDDFAHNQDYLKWCLEKGYHTATDVKDEKHRKAWLEELDDDETIELIGKYGADKATNTWGDSIGKAQEIKDATKKGLVKTAQGIIADFEILKKNELELISIAEKEVTDIENDMKETRKEISDAEKEKTELAKTLQAAKVQAPEAQIELINEQIKQKAVTITKYETKLADLEKKLNTKKKAVIGMKNKYFKLEAGIKELIAEFQEKLKYDKVFFNDYEGISSSSSEQSNEHGTVVNEVANNANGTDRHTVNAVDERSARKIGNAMGEAYKGYGLQDIQNLLTSGEYADALNSVKSGGFFKSRNPMRKKMNEYLNSLQGSKQDTDLCINKELKTKSINPKTLKEVKNTEFKCKLTYADLKNLSKVSIDKLRELERMVKYYESNYTQESMQTHEKDEAEKLMLYVAIAGLIDEADKGLFGKVKDIHSEKGQLISSIKNSSANFAELTHQRAKRGFDVVNDIRKRLKKDAKQDYSKDKRNHTVRSGNKDIKRTNEDYINEP